MVLSGVTYEMQDMLIRAEFSIWPLPINENDKINYSSTGSCDVHQGIFVSRIEIVIIYKHFTKNWSGDNE